MDGTPMVHADVLARYPKDNMLGRLLGGKYALIDVLGSGGFGAVYLALQAPLERPVAVKMIRKEATATDASLRARFFQEAKTIARLNHESIVTLYDYGEEEEDGLLYMVMERVKGHTLKSEMERVRCLEPERVVQLSLHILGALAAAHKLGVVHRDLKPDNVMISEGALGEEKVRVLDFGIAKLLEEYTQNEEQRHMTQHGLVLGTPRYMAPEVATRRGPRPQSDMYALGVMIFEMLTGKPPYTGRSGFEIMQAHVRQPLPDLTQELRLPHWLIPVLQQTLAKSPDDRFVDARAMAVALRTAVPVGRAPMPSLSIIPALGSGGAVSLSLEPPTSAPEPDPDETDPVGARDLPTAPPGPPMRQTRVDGMRTVPELDELAVPQAIPVRQPRPVTPQPARPVAVPMEPPPPVEEDVGSTSRELMGESGLVEVEAPPPRRWVRWAVAGGIVAGLTVGSLLAFDGLTRGGSSSGGAVARRPDAGVQTPHRVVLKAGPEYPDARVEAPQDIDELVEYDAVLPDDAEVSDAEVEAPRPSPPEGGRQGDSSTSPRRRGARRRGQRRRKDTPAKPPEDFRIERL